MLKILLVCLLLQLDSTKGQQQPELGPVGIQTVPEGQIFSFCFSITEMPEGGDFLVNVMANPDASPSNEFGDKVETLTFPDGDDTTTPQCVTNLVVEIDNVVQASRSLQDVFIVTTTYLGVTSNPDIVGGIFVSPDATVLNIGFTAPSYTFIEGTTQNQVCVNEDGTIMGDTILEATISYVPGTAVLANYSFSEINNDNQTDCVTLNITDFEGAETLTVQLVSAQAPLTIDPSRSMATITILDLDANCGPPPAGDGVSPTPSNPPYGVDASGMLVANPGAVATYTCDDQDNVLNFMGSAQLNCTEIVAGTSAEWVPAEAPTCTAPTEMPTTESDSPDSTEPTVVVVTTDGAPSTHGSVVMYITCAALCLGQFTAYFI